MTVLVLVCALATATCVGYYVGRRAGSTPSPWRMRTSRVAIGRLAMSFVTVLAVRRIRRTVLARRLTRATICASGLRSVEPLDFLRSGIAAVLRRTSLV
ncbi:hypothetical protein AWC29_07345 [Mycobacterium triplex]|uniref:Uncharacterized protein n=1 Tax=Mycobacterium triplex TaxID=47839 RepID=A0A024JYG0_9MYCO|nr:hypothetical protein [Mycobacterium triplex]ORX07117.1 hypothetical protein AWC29_07345 [Mycobacterium triplex]CDO88604.1 hypothetical protein BN973_02973 [Mycobacterium triplex]